MRPELRVLSLAAALAMLGVGQSVLGPFVLGHATDIIFEGVRGGRMDFRALNALLVLVFALYVAASVLMWLQGYLIAGVAQRTVYRVREDVEDKIHRVPLAFFDRFVRGEILSRVTNDIDNLAISLQNTLSQVFTAALTLLGVATMMLIVSPGLGLIALLTIPATAIIAYAVGRRSQRLFAAQWRTIGELNAQIEEAYTGHAVVKLFGRGEGVDARFERTVDDVFRSSSGAQFVSGLIVPLSAFLGNVVYVIIAVVGGIQVATGGLRLGSVQALIQYAQQLSQPVSQLGSLVNQLQSGVASAERIFQLLDAPEESEREGTVELPQSIEGRFAFENVSFRYEEEHPLLEDVSFTVEPGRTVDGQDARVVSRSSLRSRTGMVLQDTWLFEGTIRENILYGRPDASEHEFAAAVAAAHVDDFVRALPDGFDSLVVADGDNLSAGEKQLITIARAFLADPRVLILDEATSSVDTRTEVRTQRAMRALRANRTSFVIAHRLSTIRDADLILVMTEGTIIEQGTHRELIERDGAYAALYSAQFSWPAENG
jgi:ATP-binding cassette subfamily B protein